MILVVTSSSPQRTEESVFRCGDNNVASLERGNGRDCENFSNLIGDGLRGGLGESRRPREIGVTIGQINLASHPPAHATGRT